MTALEPLNSLRNLLVFDRLMPEGRRFKSYPRNQLLSSNISGVTVITPPATAILSPASLCVGLLLGRDGNDKPRVAERLRHWSYFRGSPTCSLRLTNSKPRCHRLVCVDVKSLEWHPVKSPQRSPQSSEAPWRSGRYLIAQFAAHLAHLLNTGDPTVSVKPFALFQRLLQTLAKDDYRHLVGAHLLTDGLSREELAQRYFGAVLERRLHVARANDTHKGHQLFLALCRRGHHALWPVAVLRRRKITQPASAGATPPDFCEVSDRMGRADMAISPGNPAANTREHRGALFLEVGAGRIEVAEELSVWQAIACGPSNLTRLREGAEFNAFCSLVIKALEAANAAYSAYVALGLSPLDWAEVLSVNTAKKLSVFLAEVRTEAGNPHDLQCWRRAWERRQVPGYASADALWCSELGRALRLPQTARVIDTIDIDDLPDPHPAQLQDVEVLDPADFAERLARCRAAGVIDDFEVWLYREIESGKAIDDLAQTPEARKRCLVQTAQLLQYLGQLTERVLDWVSKQYDTEEDGLHHPDSDDNVA